MSSKLDEKDNHLIQFSVFIIVFSILSALGTFYYQSWKLEGVFVNYQLMVKPKSDIVKIFAIIEEGVILQTKDGYYIGNPEICIANNQNNCWIPFLESIEDGFVESQDQGCLIKYRVKPVPRDSIQSMDYSYCDPSSGYDRFVLRSDGTIWVWHAGPHPDLAPVVPLVSVLYGFVIGFWISISLVIFYVIIVFLKKKYFSGEPKDGKRI